MPQKRSHMRSTCARQPSRFLAPNDGRSRCTTGVGGAGILLDILFVLFQRVVYQRSIEEYVESVVIVVVLIPSEFCRAAHARLDSCNILHEFSTPKKCDPIR